MSRERFLFTLMLLAATFGTVTRLDAANRSEGQNPCGQIDRACRATGFRGGAAELRRDCVEPILRGEAKSQNGTTLPAIDPQVVSACRTGTGAPVSTDLTVVPPPRPLPPAPGNSVSNSDGLLMSGPQPLFVGDNFGVHDMPDQQTPILNTNGAYELFVTGVPPGQPGGVLSVFSTTDLTKPALYHSSGVVLKPPEKKIPNCKPGSVNPNCKNPGQPGNVQDCDPASVTNDCADYIGMEAVFDAGSAGGIVGFYIADQQKFVPGNSCTFPGAFYGQLGVATAPRADAQWSMQGVTLRGADLPGICPTQAGPVAFNQPTLIKIGNEYYAYFALPKQIQGIAVARAQVQSNGLPGPWWVRVNGSWVKVPIVSGVATISKADAVVPGVPKANYVTMPWVSYNTYLRTYLMTMITHDGFYYSKLETGGPMNAAVDAQKWSTPQPFQPVPGGSNWGNCAITWENLSFVTPGTPDNHTTGKTGYVILSVVPGWGCRTKGTRSFDIASYSFGVTTPPPPPQIGQPLPIGPAPKPPLPIRPPKCPGGRAGCQY